MTAKDRADFFLALSARILTFLAGNGGQMDAGTLVRSFCKAEEVEVTDAEVALSLLLNQGEIIADREMKLERAPAIAA